MRATVVHGPGRLPDGWDAVCRSAAADLGIDVDLVGASTVPELVAAVQDGAEHANGIVLHAGAFADSVTVAAAVARAPVPVVHVDTAELGRPGGAARAACLRAIHGRGRSGFRWALRMLAARAGAGRAPLLLRTAPSPAQVLDLWLPQGPGPHPVAVLLHGGFWLHPWERDLMEGIAADLVGRGWAVGNVEYRRLGPTGGGWPATFTDVTAAFDRLGEVADEHVLDAVRCVVVGHSAGATLAVWAATRPPAAPRGIAQAPPARPPVPSAVVSLAGVLDLAVAAEADLGGGAVRALLAGAGDHRDDLLAASPVRRVPVGVPLVTVHGAGDRIVPPTMTDRFVAAARDAGDPVTVVTVPDGTGHFNVVDPASAAWQATADAMDALR